MNTPYDYMVLQSGSTTITNSQVNQQMNETWKGPWSELRKLTQLRTAAVFGFKIYPGIFRPNFESSASWKHEFDVPDVQVLNEDKKWVVTNVEARQLDAGDMGLLNIQYETRGSDTAGANAANGVPEGGQQRRPTTWTLSFQQHTRSPLAYADLSAVDSIQKCYNYGHPGTLEVAKRYNEAVTSADLKYCWIYKTGQKNADKTDKLSVEILQGEKNRKIYDYMLAGIQPQFHTPVVSRDAYFALSSGDAMSCDLGSLDKIENLPAGCPIFWRNTQWLRVEDKLDITQTNGAVVEYQRHTLWAGAPHWDTNFYGQNAWKPTNYTPTA